MNIQKAHEILKLKSQDTPYTKEEIDRMFRTLASKHHSDQYSGKSQRVREIEGKLGKKLKRDVRRKLESEKKNLEKAIAGHKREFQRLSDARSRLLTLDTGIVGAVSATEVNTKLEEYLIQSLGDFKTPKLLGAKYDKKKFTWTLKTSKINLAAIDVTQRKKVLMWLAVNIVAGRLTQNHVAFVGVPSDLSEAEKFVITFIQARVYQSKLSRMVRSMASKIQAFFGRRSISLPLSVLAIICPIVTIVLLIVLPHSVPLSIVFCVVSLLPFIVNFLNGIRAGIKFGSQGAALVHSDLPGQILATLACLIFPVAAAVSIAIWGVPAIILFAPSVIAIILDIINTFIFTSWVASSLSNIFRNGAKLDPVTLDESFQSSLTNETLMGRIVQELSISRPAPSVPLYTGGDDEVRVTTDNEDHPSSGVLHPIRHTMVGVRAVTSCPKEIIERAQCMRVAQVD